jgi:hypothetical protein
MKLIIYWEGEWFMNFNKGIKVEFSNAVIELISESSTTVILEIGNKGYPEKVIKFSLELDKEELLGLGRMCQQMYNDDF